MLDRQTRQADPARHSRGDHCGRTWSSQANNIDGYYIPIHKHYGGRRYILYLSWQTQQAAAPPTKRAAHACESYLPCICSRRCRLASGSRCAVGGASCMPVKPRKKDGCKTMEERSIHPSIHPSLPPSPAFPSLPSVPPCCEQTTPARAQAIPRQFSSPALSAALPPPRIARTTFLKRNCQPLWAVCSSCLS